MKKITDILKEIRPEFDFENVEDFFEEGMLDSFDLVSLVSSLDNEFKIAIKGTDIIPENFQNIQAIAGLLGKYGIK